MKKVLFFYLFLLHRFHVWAVKGQQVCHIAGAHAMFGLVIYANIVLILDLVGLIRGLRLPFTLIPAMDRGLFLLLVVLIFLVVTHWSFKMLALLDKAENRVSMNKYKFYGFKPWYALLYTILSFVLVSITAFLQGIGVF